MDIKRIDGSYAVSGQIEDADLEEVAAQGFKTVICNRPDDEVEPHLRADRIRAEARRLGLEFVYNPISKKGLTMDNLALQARAMADARGPVFAYCRSGNRSATCWALIQARRMPADQIVRSAASAGYDLSKLRPQIEAIAAQP